MPTAPNGTLEIIPGLALLLTGEDGLADYSGQTKIDWNGLYVTTEAIPLDELLLTTVSPHARAISIQPSLERDHGR